MIEWLKNYWEGLASNYTDDFMIDIYWKDIEAHYSSKKRYYHNLAHLYNMFLHLKECKSEIKDLDSLKFAVWFHDIIYKSTKKDNEEKSAQFAENALRGLNYYQLKIEKVKKLIISTQKHQLILTENKDNAYLLDLDLSILGADWDIYKKYIQSIRKEYKIYPDFMYKPGRKKVLNHFLERDFLYFTDYFRDKYEIQARENIKREFEKL